MISIIRKNRKILIFLLSVLLSLLIWQILSLSFNFSVIFPTPKMVLSKMFELFKHKSNYVIFLSTIFRVIISIFSSFILAFVFGILASLFEVLEDFLKFIVSALRSIPVVAIIVIVFIYFGNSKTPYIISFLMLFPIEYEGIKASFKRNYEKYYESYALESKFNLFILFKLYIPLMKNDLKTLFMQVTGLAIKVIVAAELICMTPNSIGREIIYRKNDLDYTSVFAWTIIIIILALLLEKIRNNEYKKNA